MIEIREDTPVKVSGVTSLFINTPFNEEVVNVIKQCPVSIWNKKTQTWEVPIISLSFLIDNLTFLDDIKLSIKEDNNVDLRGCKPCLEYKTKPFQHQLEGIEFGLNHNQWLLLDGMGLGKSFQIINLARELKEQRGIEHCLVICGINTLKSNWKKEIGLHSNETVRVLGEKISKNSRITYSKVSERARELKEPIEEFFVVTNIETFRSDEVVEAFQKSVNNFDMVVVDEAHKIKNKSSKQGDNLLRIEAPYKVAATGTLLLNDPLDCYVPLRWINVEHSSLTNFKSLYCRYGGFGGHEIIGFKNLDLLKSEIESCSLRRTKDLLELPPKNIIEEVLDMSDEQADFYDAIKKGVKEEADKIDLKTSSLLALVTRLRQASACPAILTTQDINSCKIDRCIDLAQQIVSNGDKVVIFSTFKETLKYVEEGLKGYNPIVVTGDSKQDIGEAVDKFQTDSRSKIFIGTWQKCGTGLTLTAASYMIFLDTPFTEAAFQQACDRIYRIGTKSSVFIYKLICRNTIDERVNDILKIKRAISDFMIDDDMSEDTLSVLRNYIEEL